MAWFEKSLNHKFTVATIAGFFMSALVFSALFLMLYQSKLENERVMVAHEVNMLLQTSLENAMLKNDLNGLRFIVKRLGDQANIRSVMITNPAGRVRFSSTSINMDRLLDKKIILHSKPQTLFMQNAQGVEILRSRSEERRVGKEC